jgi:hypothetical protein
MMVVYMEIACKNMPSLFFLKPVPIFGREGIMTALYAWNKVKHGNGCPACGLQAGGTPV